MKKKEVTSSFEKKKKGSPAVSVYTLPMKNLIDQQIH